MRKRKGTMIGSNNGNTTNIFSFHSYKNITGNNNVDWSMRLGSTVITVMLIGFVVWMISRSKVLKA